MKTSICEYTSHCRLSSTGEIRSLQQGQVPYFSSFMLNLRITCKLTTSFIGRRHIEGERVAPVSTWRWSILLKPHILVDFLGKAQSDVTDKNHTNNIGGQPSKRWKAIHINSSKVITQTYTLKQAGGYVRLSWCSIIQTTEYCYFPLTQPHSLSLYINNLLPL